MTVTEALKILQRAPKELPPFEVFLACGFTPLHLRLFLNARLQETFATRLVQVKTGIYGNLAACLEDLSHTGSDAVACAIEWPDLDQRFSFREAGSWSPSAVDDMVNGARASLDRILQAIAHIPSGVRVTVSLPTLPFPPVFHTAGWQAGTGELLIEESVAHFAASLATRRGTVVLNARRLNESSPPHTRTDLKSDLATGFPYTLSHADALASAFARLLVSAAPKKGIITDLDDTLWHGIVGDLGPENVTWDLASHHQVHGLYQKLLSSLADAGILLAVASKNDRAVVQKALGREDLLLQSNRIFPVEVHWDAKSGSVERILSAWNISADSVIFVDDSPMELAEVAASHPGIACIQFPTNQPQAALGFLRSLRDLCGKEQISEDDALRLQSIRRGAEWKQERASVSTPDDFLRAANASISVDFGAGFEDVRALELVNKTNQFNINGARYTDSEWKNRLGKPGALLMIVSYADKFGPLGKISVLQGRVDRDLLRIETWVLSCRAFARRVEYQCLRLLFDRYPVDEIELQFVPTAKNGPVADFFMGLCGLRPEGAFRIGRDQLQEKCPPLHHHITETERVETNG